MIEKRCRVCMHSTKFHNNAYIENEHYMHRECYEVLNAPYNDKKQRAFIQLVKTIEANIDNRVCGENGIRAGQSSGQ